MKRLLSALFAFLALVPAPLMAQADAQGRGALRPYIYVFVAYGLVWVLIGLWVFLIARRMGRLEKIAQSGPAAGNG